MIYFALTRHLLTDDGQILRKLDCPLNKQWSQLQVVPDDSQKRHCLSCRRSVFNIGGKSDDEIKQLFEAFPDACVFVDPDSSNLKILTWLTPNQVRDCPIRRIQTARGQDAINQGIREGFRPLVKKVEPSPKIVSRLAVYQNEETGEIRTHSGGRGHPQLPWKQIIERFPFYPYHFEHRIAGYLIPHDLEIGERVLLSDLVEDLVGMHSPTGDTRRLESAMAIWDGEEFTIQWDERKDATHLIG